MKLLRYGQFITESQKKITCPIKWTKEHCEEIALKYNSRNEFKKNSPNIYNACVRNKWLEDVCSHMGEPLIKNDFWTKDRCREEALKYKTSHEFEVGSPSAYVKSGYMGWKDEICSHMETSGNKYKRCIYAIEFSDNSVYVGLSYNFNKRFIQHLSDKKSNSVVLRHFQKTNINPIVKKLTDYLDVEEASKMESIKLQEYINNGWNILNTAKCGNIGGKTIKWTKDKCHEVALNYKTRIDFKKNSEGAYKAAQRMGWLDEICSHMIYKNNPSGYWTKERCREASLNYKNKEQFKKAKGAFSASYRNDWLDEFFPSLDKLKINETKSNSIIPSYDDCLSICRNNPAFYESKFTIDGYKISMFNYRLAKYSDFIIPIPGSDISAKEMRGLTFVFREDGSLFKRYILLEKFFNLNQTPESEYTIVSKLKIKHVNFKEDGSIASFIKLPNGKVIGKSKMSFTSDQAIQITNLYNKSEKIRKFVDWTLENDIVAIFEYVSPNNRIVLKYNSDNLILLRMRDNKTGKHLNLMDFIEQIGDIEMAPFEDENSLDDLILKAKVETGREGWIITFDNGLMIKIKTDEYLRLHGLFTEDLNRENTLIGLIVDETIDDVLAQLEEPTKKAEIEKTIEIVNKEIARMTHQVDELMSNYKGDRKDFAIKFNKHPMFPIAMGIISGKDKIDLIKQRIKIDTKNLMQAREWMKKVKERFEQ